MIFNRKEMKSCARENIAGLQPYFLLPGLAYAALSYLLAQLIYGLCGYSAYLSRYMVMMMDVMQNGSEPYAPAWPAVSPVAWILCAALLIMSMVLTVGLMWYCLRLSRQMPSRVRNLFDVFGMFTKVFLLRLIKLVLFSVCGLFFLFPAVILNYRYSFAEYVLFDHPEYGVFRCMKESAQLTRGLKKELFVLDLSLIGWYFLRSFVFLATVYVTPYEYGIKCEYYNRRSGWQPEPAENAGEEPPAASH